MRGSRAKACSCSPVQHGSQLLGHKGSELRCGLKFIAIFVMLVHLTPVTHGRPSLPDSLEAAPTGEGPIFVQ